MKKYLHTAIHIQNYPFILHRHDIILTPTGPPPVQQGYVFIDEH